MNRTHIGQIARVLVLPALLLIPALLAGQVTCGMTVQTNLVLTGPLECANGPGLIVGADGITIDLATYTISCRAGQLYCQGNPAAVGINVGGHKNVTIKGPGTIDGFDTGVSIDGGDRVSIKSLSITGPQSASTLSTHRGDASGIVVQNAGCPGSILIDGNDVSWHRYGIRLENASCVKIQRNIIHLNNNDTEESFGLYLLNSGGNTITKNDVSDNGFNNSYYHGNKFDAGIGLEGTGTTGNRISQNTVQNNCGDGIAARLGAAGNTISNNTAILNPIPSSIGSHGSCLGAPASPNMNFDLAARDPLSENRWSKTNDCWTYFGILDGICIPGE